MDEWVENTGVMPVDKGVKIDVKFRDGDIYHDSYSDGWRWDLDGSVGDIVEYKLSSGKSKEKVVVSEAVKDTNPKQAVGLSKLPMHLWPPLATAYGCLGLLNGKKYGLGNYKATPVIISIYLAAIQRHCSAFIEGQECDPVDGTPHLAAILANVAIILEARAVGTLVDDRPLQGGYLKEVDKLTKIAQELEALHKDRGAYHYTIKDNKADAIT